MSRIRALISSALFLFLLLLVAFASLAQRQNADVSLSRSHVGYAVPAPVKAGQAMPVLGRGLGPQQRLHAPESRTPQANSLADTLTAASLVAGTSLNASPIFLEARAFGSGGNNASWMAVADVNGDGKPDLVVANACGSSSTCSTGGVAVLIGNGDGTFQAPMNYASGGAFAYSVAVADVNGDGKPDVVVANNCANSSNCPSGSVGVLLGNGDGTFQAAVAYNSGGLYAYSVAVGDVNG